jgi:hypothetical protein
MSLTVARGYNEACEKQIAKARPTAKTKAEKQEMPTSDYLCTQSNASAVLLAVSAIHALRHGDLSALR